MANLESGDRLAPDATHCVCTGVEILDFGLGWVFSAVPLLPKLLALAFGDICIPKGVILQAQLGILGTKAKYFHQRKIELY